MTNGNIIPTANPDIPPTIEDIIKIIRFTYLFFILFSIIEYVSIQSDIPITVVKNNEKGNILMYNGVT